MKSGPRYLGYWVVAVVLLMAAACHREESTPMRKEKKPPPPARESVSSLTPEEEALLDIARKTLYEAVVEGRTYEPPKPSSPALLEERGVFVTLTEGGELRGCIGYVLPTKPLYLAVRDMAINSALRDPRFLPVTAAELPRLHIEISIMTPLQPVVNPSEIVVGVDGLLVEAEGRSGLLLPQVAPEQGWNREEFLDAVCRKAGLPPGAYNWPGAKLYKFQAHVFGGPYVQPAV